MNLKSLRYSILSSIVVVILSLFYALSRLGFSDLHLDSLFGFSGVSLLLLNLPTFLSDWFFSKWKKTTDTWWINELLITFYVLFFLILLSYLPVHYLYYPIAVGGILAFTINLYKSVRFAGISFIDLLVICLFSVWVASVCWQGPFLSPLFVEAIELTEHNKSSLDPLFHISIAQVIKNYGVVSNGLHMLMPLKYHFFSHFLLGRISAFTDTHLVYTYNIGFVLIFPALLLKFFLTVTSTLMAFLKIQSKNSSFILVLLIFGLTSILPVFFYNNLAVRVWIGNNSHFISESYLVSILILLIVVNTLLLVNTQDQSFKYFILLFLPIAIGLVTVSKVSTGCLVMAGLGYTFLRYGFYKSKIAMAGMVVTTAVFIIGAYSVFEEDSANGSFYLMHFFKIHVDSRFITFVCLFFFWALLGVVAAVWYGRKNPTEVAVDSQRVFGVLEVIIIIAIVGFIPPSLIEIGGGSGVYFAEIQRWIALIFVAAITPLVIPSIKPWLIQIAKIAMTLILAFNTLYFVTIALKHNLLCRTFYVQPESIEVVKSIEVENIMAIPYEKIFTEKLVDSVAFKVRKNATYNTLIQLMDLDKIDHKDKLIYLKDYSFFSHRFYCFHYFHFIPAFSGFSTFQGVDTWCVGDGYFFDRGDVKRTEYDRSEFCKTLKENNVRYLYEYDLYTNKYEILDCQ